MNIKSRFIGVVTLFVFLALFLLEEFFPVKTYKVLKITENSMLVIDLNNNKKQDEDELFAFKDIVLPKLVYSHKTTKFARNSGLNINETLTLAYVTNEYLKKLLQGKRVEFLEQIAPYNKNYSYRFAKIAYENKDIARHLLESGLVLTYKDGAPNPYAQFENLPQMKENAKYFSKLNLVVKNKNTDVYHNLDCPHAAKLKNAVFIFENKAKEQSKICKVCALYSNNEAKELKNELDKIESAKADADFGQIKAYFVNADNYFRPSPRCRTNACQALLREINSAKNSIDLALYGIESQDEIYQALLSAKARGVCIRAVVDSNLNKKDAYFDTRKLYNDFDTIGDNEEALMHNKFFVFDNKKVFTGSMNISSTGSGGYNSNTALLIESQDVAQIYKNEFNQMFEGKFQSAKQDFSKADVKIGKTSLGVYFSPKANVITSVILPEIKKAQKEILVSAFYLTHKGLIDELIGAKARGIDVKVIIDAVGSSNFKNRISLLRHNGVDVKVENWGGKNHEKNILIDSSTFITGSANFSQNAQVKNDENLLVIKDFELAKQYRAHFFKMYNSIDEKYLKDFVNPESLQSKNSCYDGVDNNFDGKVDSLDPLCRVSFGK